MRVRYSSAKMKSKLSLLFPVPAGTLSLALGMVNLGLHAALSEFRKQEDRNGFCHFRLS